MLKKTIFIIILFQLVSCGPTLLSYKIGDRMDKKQQDFPTLPHDNDIEVFYEDLNILPKDSFYIVQQLSVEQDVSKQDHIEVLKQIAKGNGLDAIIVTESTSVHKSFETSNITLLDVILGAEPECPTVEHYTVNKLYAYGVKYKSKTNLKGLVKAYNLYQIKNQKRELIKTVAPINNQLPFTDYKMLDDIKMYSLSFLIDDQSPSWTYSNEKDKEIRRYTFQGIKNYEIFRDEKQRINSIKCKSNYEMSLEYNSKNLLVNKLVKGFDFVYKEELTYNEMGRLNKKYIVKEDLFHKNREVYEFEILYYEDNEDLSNFKSILYSTASSK